MGHYTVRLLEDGRETGCLGVVQVPGSFTSDNLAEHVKRVTGRGEDFVFYVGNMMFVESVEHMAEAAHLSTEDTLDIGVAVFFAALRPRSVVETAASVSALKFSETDSSVWLATTDRRVMKYALGAGGPVLSFAKDVGEVVIQIILTEGCVFCLSATNAVLELLSGDNLFPVADARATCFARNTELVVGFENGLVATKNRSICFLEYPVVSVFSGPQEADFCILAVSSMGEILRLERGGELAVERMGMDVTACCYFSEHLYISTTVAEVLVVDLEFRTRRFAAKFLYADWIFVREHLCITSNFNEICIQKRGTDVQRARAVLDGQVVSIDGSSELLCVGAGNRLHIFCTRLLVAE